MLYWWIFIKYVLLLKNFGIHFPFWWIYIYIYIYILYIYVYILRNIFIRILFHYHPGAIDLLLLLLAYNIYIFDNITYESVDILLCHRSYTVRKSEIKILLFKIEKKLCIHCIHQYHEVNLQTEKHQSSERTTVKIQLSIHYPPIISFWQNNVITSCLKASSQIYNKIIKALG